MKRIDLVTGLEIEDERVATMTNEDSMEALKSLSTLPEPEMPKHIPMKPASTEMKALMLNTARVKGVKQEIEDWDRRKPTRESILAELIELGDPNPDNDDIQYALTKDLEIWQSQKDELLKLLAKLQLSPSERYELELKEAQRVEKMQRAKEKEDRAMELLRARTDEKIKLLQARELIRASAEKAREIARAEAAAEKDAKKRFAKAQKVQALVTELSQSEPMHELLLNPSDL